MLFSNLLAPKLKKQGLYFVGNRFYRLLLAADLERIIPVLLDRREVFCFVLWKRSVRDRDKRGAVMLSCVKLESGVCDSGSFLKRPGDWYGASHLRTVWEIHPPNGEHYDPLTDVLTFPKLRCKCWKKKDWLLFIRLRSELCQLKSCSYRPTFCTARWNRNGHCDFQCFFTLYIFCGGVTLIKPKEEQRSITPLSLRPLTTPSNWWEYQSFQKGKEYKLLSW